MCTVCQEQQTGGQSISEGGRDKEQMDNQV